MVPGGTDWVGVVDAGANCRLIVQMAAAALSSRRHLGPRFRLKIRSRRRFDRIRALIVGLVRSSPEPQSERIESSRLSELSWLPR